MVKGKQCNSGNSVAERSFKDFYNSFVLNLPPTEAAILNLVYSPKRRENQRSFKTHKIDAFNSF